MSDCNHDVKQKMCQMGKCKPTPGALTREELRDVLTIDNSIMYRIPKSTRENVLAHDAALRATIEQRDGQIEKLAAFIVLIPGEPSKSEGAVDTAIRIITQQVRELAESKSELSAWKKHGHSKEQQLAASQARVKELEAQWHYAATHDADMDYVKEIAQLQATLAAREAQP